MVNLEKVFLIQQNYMKSIGSFFFFFNWAGREHKILNQTLILWVIATL